jgi:hypothetical protein
VASKIYLPDETLNIFSGRQIRHQVLDRVNSLPAKVETESTSPKITRVTTAAHTGLLFANAVADSKAESNYDQKGNQFEPPTLCLSILFPISALPAVVAACAIQIGWTEARFLERFRRNPIVRLC